LSLFGWLYIILFSARKKTRFRVFPSSLFNEKLNLFFVKHDFLWADSGPTVGFPYISRACPLGNEDLTWAINLTEVS
jgi:hypothetical protein